MSDEGRLPPGEFILDSIQGNIAFNMGSDNKVFFVIRHDGSIELGEGIQMDEASRMFWSFVFQHTPLGKIHEFLRTCDQIKILHETLAYGNNERSHIINIMDRFNLELKEIHKLFV